MAALIRRPTDAKNIRCKMLVVHGGNDPYVPRKDLEAFSVECRPFEPEESSGCSRSQ
jgi:dienelactone hydrolase